MSEPTPSGPELVCRTCGARVSTGDAAATLGWSRTVVGDQVHVHCPRCSREHVRSMEAKLDEQYW